MSRGSRALAFAVAFAIGLPAAAAAVEVVFEQLPTKNGYYSDLKEHPSSGYQMEADAFELAQRTQLTRLEFWGSKDSPYFDAFYVRILTNEGGLPGTIVYEESFALVPNIHDYGYRIYGIELPAVEALDLPGGTVFWLSVAGANAFTGDPTENEIFDWCAGDGTGYARQFGLEAAWMAANFSEPAFRLLGEPLTPTEPLSVGTVKLLY